MTTQDFNGSLLIVFPSLLCPEELYFCVLSQQLRKGMTLKVNQRLGLLWPLQAIQAITSWDKSGELIYVSWLHFSTLKAYCLDSCLWVAFILSSGPWLTKGQHYWRNENSNSWSSSHTKQQLWRNEKDSAAAGVGKGTMTMRRYQPVNLSLIYTYRLQAIHDLHGHSTD